MEIDIQEGADTQRLAWHTALLHEGTCKAVMGMAVPYTRAEDTNTFINPPGMDDRFWYMRYFQEPGVAEAEMEADVRRALIALVGYREVWIDGVDTFVQLACEMLSRNRVPSAAIRPSTGAVSRR